MPQAAFPRLAAAAPRVRNDRQEAVLRAAEKLFALHGYHAVTIRQIAREADVPSALVGYYFGHKQDLFHAIFAHRRSLHAAHLDALADAVAAPAHPMALQRLVRALVQPFVRWRQNPDDAHHVLLLAREIARAGHEAEPVLQAFVDPLAMRFIDALIDLHPGLSREDAGWAYRFAVGALLHHLVDDRASMHPRTVPHAAPACGTDQLVDFIVGGAQAILRRPSPASPTTPEHALP